jgi:hypothetical protein
MPDEDGISQGERRFWEGQNIFSVMAGAGLCIVAEHPIWGGICIVVGFVGFFASRRKSTMKPKAYSVVWVIALLFTWAAVGYDYYDRRSRDDIPEFDDPRARGLSAGYGPDAGKCIVVANGDLLLAYQSKFFIAPSCFIANGTVAMLDTTEIQTGTPREINAGPITMSVVVTDEGLKQDIGNHVYINFVILLIPKDVQLTQFKTLRQARLLGVKIKMMGSTRW